MKRGGVFFTKKNGSFQRGERLRRARAPRVAPPRLAKKPRERAPSPRATAYALTGTPRKRKIVLPRPSPSAREPWFLWVLLFGRPLDIDGPVLCV